MDAESEKYIFFTFHDDLMRIFVCIMDGIDQNIRNWEGRKWMLDRALYYIGAFLPFGYVIWFLSVIYVPIILLKENLEHKDDRLSDQAKKMADRMRIYKKKELEEQDSIFTILKIRTQLYQYFCAIIVGGGAIGGIFSGLAKEYLNCSVWGLWLIVIFIASYFMGHLAKFILDDFVYFNMIQEYRKKDTWGRFFLYPLEKQVQLMKRNPLRRSRPAKGWDEVNNCLPKVFYHTKTSCCRITTIGVFLMALPI